MKAAGLKAIGTILESSAVLIKSKHPSNLGLVNLIASRIRGVISESLGSGNNGARKAYTDLPLCNGQPHKSTFFASTTSIAKIWTPLSRLRLGNARQPSTLLRPTAGLP